jgi:DNA-binding NarL/FixJ family response regulator
MLAGRRILLVEDQPLIVVSIRDILQGLSAELVGPGMTIEQAMYLAGSESMDAAILDVWLQGKACYPVGDLLARRGIPFAVIGGRAVAGEPDSFLQAPRLPKPFTSDELARTLVSLF